MARTDIFRARTEFATIIDGAPLVVHKGELVREGHPLLKGRANLFEPYEPEVRYDVKQATAPSERRNR